MVTVHSWYALSVAVLASSVSVAVAAPVFALVAVNVVVPHPLALGVASVPNWNVGSRSAMVSGVEVSNGEFSAKMYVTDDGA
jgi:hypothetical protein